MKQRTLLLLQIVASDGQKFSVQFFDNGEELILKTDDIKPFPEVNPKNMKAKKKKAFNLAR